MLVYDESKLQESLSFPIPFDMNKGYLVVSLIKDKKITTQQIQVLQTICSSLSKIDILDGSSLQRKLPYLDENAVGFDQLKSNVFMIRTFLKMLAKRIPQDDYIGLELVDNTMSKSYSTHIFKIHIHMSYV
jgi:hypothetical protein